MEALVQLEPGRCGNLTAFVIVDTASPQQQYMKMSAFLRICGCNQLVWLSLCARRRPQDRWPANLLECIEVACMVVKGSLVVLAFHHVILSQNCVLWLQLRARARLCASDAYYNAKRYAGTAPQDVIQLHKLHCKRKQNDC